jgi:hypothetical protein
MSALVLRGKSPVQSQFFLNEAMRPYPPGVMLGRPLVEQNERLHSETAEIVLLSPWLTHRNRADGLSRSRAVSSGGAMTQRAAGASNLELVLVDVPLQASPRNRSRLPCWSSGGDHPHWGHRLHCRWSSGEAQRWCRTA